MRGFLVDGSGDMGSLVVNGGGNLMMDRSSFVPSDVVRLIWMDRGLMRLFMGHFMRVDDASDRGVVLGFSMLHMRVFSVVSLGNQSLVGGLVVGCHWHVRHNRDRHLARGLVVDGDLVSRCLMARSFVVDGGCDMGSLVVHCSGLVTRSLEVNWSFMAGRLMSGNSGVMLSFSVRRVVSVSVSNLKRGLLALMGNLVLGSFWGFVMDWLAMVENRGLKLGILNVRSFMMHWSDNVRSLMVDGDLMARCFRAGSFLMDRG